MVYEGQGLTLSWQRNLVCVRESCLSLFRKLTNIGSSRVKGGVMYTSTLLLCWYLVSFGRLTAFVYVVLIDVGIYVQPLCYFQKRVFSCGLLPPLDLTFFPASSTTFPVVWKWSIFVFHCLYSVCKIPSINAIYIISVQTNHTTVVL